MKKAYKDTLHGIIPNSYHDCCVAHMLSLVLEIWPTIFKEMTTLVTLIKRVFCQSLLCRRLFRDFMERSGVRPKLHVPVYPVLTRCGTWVNAVAEYLDVLVKHCL